MSYLLDALRKAERERNLGRVPELDYSSADNTEGGGRRLPLWVAAIVLGLVALNLLLLATFWWVTKDSPEPNEPAGQAAVDSASLAETAPKQAKQAPAGQAPAQTSDHSLSEPESNPSPIIQPQPTQSGPAASQQQAPQPELVPAHDIPDRPLPEQTERSEEIEHYNSLAPSERVGVPAVRINGHLFSSIPGRSFVLVNGRRYHEGQRLPEGPAIVIIDEQGAILNYRDTRYRLDAPR